jgi:hypothetical protein
MKITDPEVIKSGEKDLIDSVQEDLDLGAVREILKERMAVAALASKGGQIVVHDNEIAFRLDFEVSLSGSLLFDRDGNYIDDKTKDSPEPEAASEGFPELEEEISLTDGISEDDLDLDDELREEAFSFPDPDELDTSSEVEEDADSDLSADLDEDTEEELSIDLPDYDLDDDLDEGISDDMDLDQDDELELSGMDEGDNLLIDDDLELDDEDDLELDADLDEDAPFNEDEDSQDLDDDINDILKESREFWEQKKDS